MNFLNILEEIVNVTDIQDKTVLEIGPGTGNLTSYILKKNPKTIGIYRIIMKAGSDNFRESAILEIIDKLIKKNIQVYVYEPLLNEIELNGAKKIKDLDKFISTSDLIIANRISNELKGAEDKIYSRDIFGDN